MHLNLLLVGNTGSGKSYLLNSLGGSFESGFSVVHGLTDECDYCDIMFRTSELHLIDVPGLLEATDEKIARNAEVITNALRMKGQFKLIFVLAECAGCVVPSDLFAIRKVLSAIDFSIDVGVIINKVPDKDLELYNNTNTRDSIIWELNSVANGKINHLWFAVIPWFSKKNPYGATEYMTALLSEMTYQGISRVKPIKAMVKEYNLFVAFLKMVGNFFEGLWEKFLEWTLNPIVIAAAKAVGTVIRSLS